MFTYDQIAIMFTGVLACLLSQSSKPERRKWACIFGIAGQPFWFIAAWKANQVGILVLNCMYAGAWIKGFYTNWISPWKTSRRARIFIQKHDGLFRNLTKNDIQ